MGILGEGWRPTGSSVRNSDLDQGQAEGRSKDKEEKVTIIGMGEIRDQVFRKQEGRCFYCDRKMHRGKDDFGRDMLRFTVDHKTPLCRGGATDMLNCVGACRRCNSMKGWKVKIVLD